MRTAVIEIVDRGRGPQLSTSRITVLDFFYYLHRGFDFDSIRQVMPTLTDDEFETILAYVRVRRKELETLDRRAEELRRQRIEAQRARGGIFADHGESRCIEEHLARLREILARKKAEADDAQGNPR